MHRLIIIASLSAFALSGMLTACSSSDGASSADNGGGSANAANSGAGAGGNGTNPGAGGSDTGATGGTTSGAGGTDVNPGIGGSSAGTGGTNIGIGAGGTNIGIGAGGMSVGKGTGGQAGTGGNMPGFSDGPPAGNPDGHCNVPTDARAEDSSRPDHVIGDGTPTSCTGNAFVDAVAQGGVITFNCGPSPVMITLTKTAKIFNDKGPKIVIDGGGKVTLDGGGKVRILYQDTCDSAQHYTSAHCDNQATPQLTVQNLTFANGNATGQLQEGGGGGAILVRGGRLKVVNSRFFSNVCDPTGPDLGGAAIRTLSQYNNLPLYVVNSTFGGKQGLGNSCSNGGGLSSIGVSYSVFNSLFSYNSAIGHGQNPAHSGTPGGGSGGAIYNDGNTYTLNLCGTKIENNHANEGGGAIFFVSNDRSGSLVINESTLKSNRSGTFETAGYPGIFVLAKGNPQVTNSTLQQ